jgi:4a-hydroxytetrahydrobiopterin dehydratase
MPDTGGDTMAPELVEKTCTPCRGSIPPPTQEEAEGYRSQVPEWALMDGTARIERTYRFPNFRDTFAFVQGDGDLAEAQGHHPDVAKHLNLQLRFAPYQGLSRTPYLQHST